MITAAGLLPTDPRAKELWHNTAALLFTDEMQRRADEERLETYSKMLGILWTRDDVQEQDTHKIVTTAADQVFMPLAMVIRPELRDSIKKMFGKTQGIDAPDWIKGTDLVNLGSLDRSRDEFMDFVRQFVAPKVATAPGNF